MIEPWVAQELRQIERGLDTDDPRFVDGFRHSTPCPPREYRRYGRRLLPSVALAFVLFAGLLASFVVLLPIAVVAVVAAGLVGLFVIVLPRCADARGDRDRP